MFTYPTTQIAPGPSGAATPAEIFSGNLPVWFDARVGITLDGGGDVSGWANQGSGGDATQLTEAQNPAYTASGPDGTAQVDFADTNTHSLGFTDSVPSQLTCWVFMNNTVSTNLTNLFWSNSNWSLWVQAFSANDRPGIFNGSWFQATATNGVGWNVTRLSVRDDGVGSCAFAVNDVAEDTISINWAPGGASWAHLSRSGAAQNLHGEVKQIVMTDLFIDDADSRNQDMLDYFKDVYPTLVTY